MRMFARDGISATPTATIAASAGIAHGTLFAHFATREDLIAEIITRFLRRLAVRLQKAIEDKATLGDFLTSHLDGLAENEDFYRRLLQEQSTLPPYARATILSMQSVISLQLSKVITRRSGGREQGGGCHDLLFNTWIGLVHHYILNRDLFSPGQAVCRSRRDELVDHFCLLMKNHED
jgi:AcrR family transcriptional regulator